MYLEHLITNTLSWIFLFSLYRLVKIESDDTDTKKTRINFSHIHEEYEVITKYNPRKKIEEDFFYQLLMMLCWKRSETQLILRNGMECSTPAASVLINPLSRAERGNLRSLSKKLAGVRRTRKPATRDWRSGLVGVVSLSVVCTVSDPNMAEYVKSLNAQVQEYTDLMYCMLNVCTKLNL